MKIEVYTDGSATIASKPGGYGYVIVIDGTKHSEGFGRMERATNNDAEMMAAIQGLGALLKIIIGNPSQFNEDKEVYLVSDSQLVLGWTNGNFRFKQKEKMKNYETLKDLSRRLKVKTRWVEGHSGDEHNERCDKLANKGRLGDDKPVKAPKTKKEATTKTLIGYKKKATMAVYFEGIVKIIDLENNIVENYNPELHGER